LIVTGTPLVSAVRTLAESSAPEGDLTFDYFTDDADLTFDYFTDDAGKPNLCCCRQEGGQVECQLSDMTTKAVAFGMPGKCETYLGKGWTSWYNIKKLKEDDGPVQSCQIREADVPKATTTTTTERMVRTLAESSAPEGDLTFDHFTDDADLTFDYFTDDAGKPNLCCCRQEGGQVECQLSDMTTKAVAFGMPGKCETYLGKGWTSWYNIKNLKEDDGPVQSCQIREADVPKATTTTTTERMKIIDMSLNGNPDNAFAAIGYKMFKCCCRSDVAANVKASKEIRCELFNVESGSNDLASGYFTSSGKMGCKQMAAKKHGNGDGWHAYNNMGSKYSHLDYYGVCAVPN